jgi:hypothetical protein
MMVFWVFIFAFGIAVTEGLLTTFVNSELEVLFDTLEGIIAGAGLALFAGRLDSRLMKGHLSLIALLYIYALIQSGYPFVVDPNRSIRMFVFITGFAFFAKVTMYLHVRERVGAYDLTYYLISYRRPTEEPAPIKEIVIEELKGEIPAALEASRIDIVPLYRERAAHFRKLAEEDGSQRALFERLARKYDQATTQLEQRR